MEHGILHFFASPDLAEKIVTFLGASLGPPLAIFTAIFCVEFLSGADRRRYVSRGFVIDVCHYLFYAGGLFTWLIFNPLTAVLKVSFSGLHLELLAQIPAALAFLLNFLYVDFVSYWLHRALHANRFLWAFHCVHHSPTQLTGVTTLRRHLGEILINTIFAYVVIVLPLGNVTSTFWPIVALLWGVRVLESVHHAELHWHFGPFYRVVVSPVYHAIHHSADPAHHNKNYAILFSLWDYLFGTASAARSRPHIYGLGDTEVSESFTGQFVIPWKNGARRLFLQAEKCVSRA